MLAQTCFQLADIFDSHNAIPLVGMIGGFSIAIIGILAGAISKTTTTKQREETKREIAAYVAEGSMAPEEAARILEAGSPYWERGKKSRLS